MSMTTAEAEGYRWFGNSLIAIRLSAGDGADGLCLVEQWLPPGEAPPEHLHRNEDEVFHLLAGELRIRVGTAERLVRAGETLVAPKGVPHAFAVTGEEGAHLLTVTRGGDFEAMLRQASRPAATPTLPEAGVPDAGAIAHLTECCRRNAIEIVGPPLA
ncbi:cupin domain-containing protein [Zavarzinia sp.]|uniref:cupin domain-containing protein n=1 Tax=Zavarzinia sp. TaxID=2027920 RepID=UPI003565FCAC